MLQIKRGKSGEPPLPNRLEVTKVLFYSIISATLFIINKAKQNRAFASVTYKIRRAHFPVRVEKQ